MAAGALSALSGVALLATSAYLITRAAEMPPVLYLQIAITSVRLFALSRAAFRYGERLLSHDAAFRQLAVVRTELYRRLVRVAPAGLQRTGRGDLLSRMVTDVDALQDLPLRVIQPLVISGLTALAAVIGVFAVEPVAGAVLLVGLVVAFLVSGFVADRLARTTERAIAERRGVLSDAVLDTVQNLDVLVAFDAVGDQLARVSALDADLRRVLARRATASGVVSALISLLSGAAVFAAIVVAAPHVVAHGLIGPGFALVALVPMAVFEVVGAVPVAVLARRKVRASAARVDHAVPAVVPVEVVVDSAFEDEDARGAAIEPLALPTAGGVALELRSLRASWPGAAHPALRDLDLTVRVGERIVVEGPSGAGKSTLANVLVRFLAFEGTYEVGGVDAASVDAERVRATVGLIEQNAYLFDENVRQNLLFARDDATDAELVAVLERVGLGSWLAARGGLDARIGERGALVSGGQAQRISLARALLRGFPVLVLDEPAAGVDSDVADRLVDDVLRTARDDGTTVVLISHVPVSAEFVTRRIVVRDGAVVADTRRVDKEPVEGR